MDTEKHLEIEKKITTGQNPNDEGPYYHHAWWESYKGSVKGKLGGIVIGGLIGSIIGAAVVGALALVGVAGPTLGLALAAFGAAGTMYGFKEFGEIGKGVGNTASQFRLFESRTRTMVDGKVAEIKEELGEIKSLLTGKDDPYKEELARLKKMAAEDEGTYRKAHYAKLTPAKINSLAFWKVALIGLAVGATVGALLAIGGPASAAAVILEHIGIAHGLGATGLMVASVATMGALGATFGINRDFFRKVFDRTDLWFKGMLSDKSHAIIRKAQAEAGQKVQDQLNSTYSDNIATTILPDSTNMDYPKSETHFRDKVLPAAQRALLNFDHTRATPQ